MYEVIKSIIADVANIDINSITPNADLKDLGMDSLSVLEAVLAIETHYNIRFAAAEICSQTTVADIVRLTESKADKNV